MSLFPMQPKYPLPKQVDANSVLNQNLAAEYRTLFNLNQLTDQHAQRLEDILNLARQDKQLDLMITNIICDEGQIQGLASHSSLDSYRNQMAVLREYQETNFSGLDNTMFGNTSIKVNSNNCTPALSEQDVSKIEAEIQKEAGVGDKKVPLPR